MQRTFQWFIYIKRPISESILSLSAGTEGFERLIVDGRPWTSKFYRLLISKRMTAPAKPKQMSPFGLVSKFLPGPHRLLKLRNIRKRPELRFWSTRWTLKRGLIEIWMRILKLSLSNQTRLESKQIRELKVPGVTMKERIKARFKSSWERCLKKFTMCGMTHFVWPSCLRDEYDPIKMFQQNSQKWKKQCW